jgi:hypothetical protein
VLWKCFLGSWNAGALGFYFCPPGWSGPEVAETGEFGLGESNVFSLFLFAKSPHPAPSATARPNARCAYSTPNYSTGTEKKVTTPSDLLCCGFPNEFAIFARSAGICLPPFLSLSLLLRALGIPVVRAQEVRSRCPPTVMVITGLQPQPPPPSHNGTTALTTTSTTASGSIPDVPQIRPVDDTQFAFSTAVFILGCFALFAVLTWPRLLTRFSRGSERTRGHLIYHSTKPQRRLPLSNVDPPSLALVPSKLTIIREGLPTLTTITPSSHLLDLCLSFEVRRQARPWRGSKRTAQW